MQYDNYGNPIPNPSSHVQGGPYGAPPSYGQPSSNPYAEVEGFGSEMSELKDNATLWLIVGLAGFWFGFGWITGPLAWHFGGRVRRRFRSLGHEPSGAATGAWVTGIVTTLLTYAAIIAVFFVLVTLGSALMMAY